ncbi:MAG: type II toxin-antitoxin system death-on-curing family toxin [Bacteroidia bacterium]|nr:type II toxin-antitoxin system death-on-curing family toxin [Bacteroidia bacterium]
MNDKKDIIYLTSQEIIEFNILALNLIQTKKADKSEVLSYRKIQDIVTGCQQEKGDIYDKAVYLLKNTIKKHAFASGNRRTAFIITKHFLLLNEIVLNIKDEPEYAKIMTGIRENYYADNEIKNWIKYGQIREFKRS